MKVLNACLTAVFTCYAAIAVAQDASDWFVLPPTLQAQALGQAGQTQATICGDAALVAERIPDIEGAGGCGVEDAIRLRSVSGVALSVPATIDCETARALRTWVDQGVKPAVGETGGGVVSLRVVAHYACRTRNNQAGARMSEHALGHAIDIAGIGLADGREMTVLTDWSGSEFSTALRQMWRAACGPFGTVLGPEADRFHLDHFHFDTARYRSGSYCR